MTLRILFGRTVSVGLLRRFFLEIEAFAIAHFPESEFDIDLVSDRSALQGLTVTPVGEGHVPELRRRLLAIANELRLQKVVVEAVDSVEQDAGQDTRDDP